MTEGTKRSDTPGPSPVTSGAGGAFKDWESMNLEERKSLLMEENMDNLKRINQLEMKRIEIDAEIRVLELQMSNNDASISDLNESLKTARKVDVTEGARIDHQRRLEEAIRARTLLLNESPEILEKVGMDVTRTSGGEPILDRVSTNTKSTSSGQCAVFRSTSRSPSRGRKGPHRRRKSHTNECHRDRWEKSYSPKRRVQLTSRSTKRRQQQTQDFSR